MIPRTIHQIWLGEQVPPQVDSWLQRCRSVHSGWSYKLWRDKDVPTLRNQAAFDAATNYAMKADILRYEILLNQGGVYVDADFECHRPFDPLIATRNRLLVSEFGIVTNSIMGCEPNDSFVRSLVDAVGQRVSGGSIRGMERPHELTGPYLVDELFISTGQANTPDILVPGDYFFPPRTRNRAVLERASSKRYATHHALATWRDSRSLSQRIRSTKPRTRLRRFLDLSAD